MQYTWLGYNIISSYASHCILAKEDGASTLLIYYLLRLQDNIRCKTLHVCSRTTMYQVFAQHHSKDSIELLVVSCNPFNSKRVN